MICFLVAGVLYVLQWGLETIDSWLAVLDNSERNEAI